ncbi:MAG TPA: tryptophan--tRNA ligase [Elusimicrobiota bacterium]|nr:tryptophan--tRNA ligase [Elusimicrobiota bacterium]
MKRQDVVYSGMRPTGRLHLGNYWGALKNWVDLQTQYSCIFSVADWHMLTTGYGDTSSLRQNVREMVLDWLAAGLDPQKCVIYRQSDVPEHAELALMLAMVTPLSSVENNPTWKEQLQELSKTKMGKTLDAKAEEAVAAQAMAHAKAEGAPPAKVVKAAEKAIETAEATAAQYEIRTYGFLGYPVLQAADILLYHGTKVPVGADQLPHLELTREIARKFNNAFGEVFAEPQGLLTPTPKVPGTDGRKMSKSYGNAIEIYETEKSLEKKVKGMYTDPNRKSATDPGHPLPCAENPPGCSVYALHKLYADEAFYQKRGDECRAGQLGCSACKKDLLAEMTSPFGEFRRRRDEYAAQPEKIDAILDDGARKARAIAQKTMDDVRRAMRLR